MDPVTLPLIAVAIVSSGFAINARLRVRRLRDLLGREAFHRDRLERALDSAKMGIWDVDKTTGRITWSRYHEILFGYLPGTFDGTSASFRSRVHPDDLPRLLRGLRTSIENHCEYQSEVRVVHPDGTMLWVRGRGMPYYNEDGKCIRMMGTIVDVTDRRIAEEKLITVMDQLRKANSVKDQFLANISHDIRTPLSAVIGYTDILLEEQGDNSGGGGSRNYLRRIRDNAAALLVQIDAIIQTIQADSDDFRVSKNRIHITGLIQSFCRHPRQTAQRRSIQVFSRTETERDIIVTDHDIVATIIDQILDYSARYTDAEFVYIQAVVQAQSPEAGILEIRIRDSGRSTTPPDSMVNFNLHTLQSGSTKNDFSGLEIGLPLAVRLANIIGGSVSSIAPGEQRGSEFTITIPVTFPKAEGTRIVPGGSGNAKVFAIHPESIH